MLIGLAAAALLVPPTPAGAAVPFCPQTQNGSAITVTCDFTGAPQRWEAPAGVSAVNFTVSGASGGSKPDPLNRYEGGRGANVTGTLPVTPLAGYDVVVGGAGTSNNGTLAACGIYPGYNGGGTGGQQGPPSMCTYSGWANGAGGGGASDIRSAGGGLGARLVVAGGGGGASIGYGGNAGYNGDRGGYAQRG
jgi:hypothetical protein